jgi:hypothetical protein
MTRRIVLYALAGPFLVASGCADLMPDVCMPGPAAYQRKRAERMDPYPEVEAGPEMVGSRPREFSRPPPEATRASPYPPSWQRPNRTPLTDF